MTLFRPSPFSLPITAVRRSGLLPPIRHATTTAGSPPTPPPSSTTTKASSSSSSRKGNNKKHHHHHHHLGPNTLSLDQFLQRSRVLSLYRTICRGTTRIADPTSRAETRGFARAEFERHRDVRDADKVRYLLSVGKTEWEAMERYMG